MSCRTKLIGSQTDNFAAARVGRRQAGASNHIITPASAAIAAARTTIRRNVFPARMPVMLPGPGEAVVNERTEAMRASISSAAPLSLAWAGRRHITAFRV
jgi:hypothetical protein